MTGRRAQHRGVAMERSTVQNASYRPIAVSARCRPPRAAPAKRHVSFGTVTVHRDAYRPPSVAAAAVRPTRSSAPRDHAFLAGDGTSRFRSTSYQTDYPARVLSSQKRGNDFSRRHSHVPISSEPGLKGVGERSRGARPVWTNISFLMYTFSNRAFTERIFPKSTQIKNESETQEKCNIIIDNVVLGK